MVVLRVFKGAKGWMAVGGFIGVVDGDHQSSLKEIVYVQGEDKVRLSTCKLR